MLRSWPPRFPPTSTGACSAERPERDGASPRALQAIIRTARVRALFSGRAHASFDDLRAVARPVLSHRILLKTVSELDGVTVDATVDAILDEWQDAPGE